MRRTEKITPYYRNLLNRLGPEHPLRKTVFAGGEPEPAPGEIDDPLGEEAHTPVPGVVHTYYAKALLFANFECAVHCRYCTRGRWVGRPDSEGLPLPEILSPAAFHYLEQHPEIHDVLVSGGDPLLLSADSLDRLLARLREIRHVRTIRLGSKIPAVDPRRITPQLADVLAARRVWLQLHIIHPAELTPDCTRACSILADAGVPMVSQTVLLKGINDDAEILAELFTGLLERRVKPYYLFQCDPVTGSSAFRTPVETGLELIRSLYGRISGLAMPHFAVDVPGGGGKIELLPGMPFRRSGDEVIFTGPCGNEYAYPESDLPRDSE